MAQSAWERGELQPDEPCLPAGKKWGFVQMPVKMVIRGVSNPIFDGVLNIFLQK